MARLKSLAALLGLLALRCNEAVARAIKQPNVVFILTDDQDYEMQSLHYMPLLQEHILNKGTQYDRHYCTVAICCPSRVNLWTGRAAHNTNVTDLKPPYGGYPKFVAEGLNSAWLPVWLQELGYNTYYTGKLFNTHNIQNYNAPYVQGFNGSDFLLDPYTYEYFNAWMTRNGAEPVSYAGQYSVDVVAEKGLGFIDEGVQHRRETGKPFFVGIAPIAPHSNMRVAAPVTMDMPFYAERHKHLFKDYKILRTESFNKQSGVGWVRMLPELNDTVLEYHDEFVRSRLRSLQAVDELVEGVVKRLEESGELDNTYIIYSSDNGYHVSQHRLPPGKECAFEEDIHVPLAIRGPGVPHGHVAQIVSSHTDLTPTILKLAGSDRFDLDGSPIPLTEQALAHPASGEHVNVEYWGMALPEGKYGKIGDTPWSPLGDIAARNNTYKALRLRSNEDYDLLYVVWCTGDRELYDTRHDPYQVYNLLNEDGAHLASNYSIAGRSLKYVLDRIDSLLMVTKSCKAETCRLPWSDLHPDGKVKSLKEALRKEFDEFYREQPRVAFSSCQLGYLKAEEGPQEVNVWGTAQQSFPDQQQPLQLPGHWSWWT